MLVSSSLFPPARSSADSTQPISRSDIVFAALIGLLVAVVYGQVVGHQFVGWDDNSYVSENRRVLQGLHWGNVVWAFSTFQLSNWHPLTLISHMADISLWGPKAGAHAIVNAGLHSANACLLYFLLCRLELSGVGGSVSTIPLRAPAFLVAALFAVHPLHVESVAWISERKDVLCAFFWLLSMHAYVRYARRPSLPAYALVSLLIALALLAKPMAVSLPLVLLILDVWVLRRVGGVGDPRVISLLFEKLPWLALAAGTGILTILAQTQAMPPFAPLERIQVALVAYGWYLEKTFWPDGLHYYYITESAWSVGRLIVSSLVLGAVTAFLFRLRHRQPAWWAGWLWFLVTLLPVVGFVKVGTQAWADRYAYLPHVGLFWTLVSMGGCLPTVRRRRPAALVAAVAIVAILGVLGWRQVAVWRDTDSLYRHALAQNPGNYVAMMGLANQAIRRKDYVQAQDFARRALVLSKGPALVRSMHAALGEAAVAAGDLPLAISHFTIGAEADPIDDSIRIKLGYAFVGAGRVAEAEAPFREARRLAEDPVEALNGLGIALGLQGRWTESYAALREGIALAPEHSGLRRNLAATALRAGDIEMARRAYQELARLFPDDAAARQTLFELSRAGH